MTERKVLNKYFPPDYDPAKIPRMRRGGHRKQFNIRTMAPFNMRCNTCNGYIYKAKKFNSRMETAENVDYLGLRHYRFYIRCPTCCAEIIWRTDLENGDYVLESGAKRNFEALKTAEELEAKRQAEEEEELKNNPMKLLEKRTDQSKQEMEMVEVIEDLKQLNQRQAGMEADHVLLKELWKEEEAVKKAQEEADEALVKELLESRTKPPTISSEITVSENTKTTGMVLKRDYLNLPSAVNKNAAHSYLKRQLQSGVIIRKTPNLQSTKAETSNAQSSTSSQPVDQDHVQAKYARLDTNLSALPEPQESCSALPGMVYSDHSDSD